MQPWQALFFDFDGVLVDSVEVKTRAFGRLFEPYGPGIAYRVIEHHRRHSGVSRFDKFRHYYEAFLGEPLSDEGLSELCRRFARMVVDEVVAAPEIPGAVAFLKKWHGRVRCFVVSATPQEEIREIVRRRGWEGYFVEATGSPAPKSENLLRLLRSYSLQPERCLFFGDAESDYLAARSCRVPFLGVLPGNDAPLLRAAPQVSWIADFTATEELKALGLN